MRLSQAKMRPQVVILLDWAAIWKKKKFEFIEEIVRSKTRIVFHLAGDV